MVSFGDVVELLGLAGKVEEARAVLAELTQLSPHTCCVPSQSVAIVHTGLGEYDLAFEWLEKALAERDPGLMYLKVQPAWEPLRDDPRFADLISRIPYFIED